MRSTTSSRFGHSYLVALSIVIALVMAVVIAIVLALALSPVLELLLVALLASVIASVIVVVNANSNINSNWTSTRNTSRNTQNRQIAYCYSTTCRAKQMMGSIVQRRTMHFQRAHVAGERPLPCAARPGRAVSRRRGKDQDQDQRSSQPFRDVDFTFSSLRVRAWEVRTHGRFEIRILRLAV